LKKLLTASAAIALTAALYAAPAQAANTHTIKQNDTFWKLSLQYQIPLSQMIEANPGVDPLNLQIGATLKLPSAADAVQAQTADSNQAKEQTAQATAAKAAAEQSEPAVVSSDGQKLAYTDKLSLKATAYTAAASENGKWGAVDYFGNALKVGTVAVDPKMIPLGTKLYITGYDYNGLPAGGMIAKATDMGGSIKGNRIDIFVPHTTQQARKFGIQNVQVYVLK
jgi:Uncharacterized protein conserved in bacteria